MRENICDIFLKEYETFPPIHGMIQSSYDKPKTPYQLDLEVKDRKPSIVPKVGDRVKIKSREWYEKWKKGSGFVDVLHQFSPLMVEFCGEVLTVEEIRLGHFRMKEDKRKWDFSPEMFEEVYPVQEQLSSKFPKIDINNPSLYQSPYEVRGSDAVAVKCSDFAAKVEEVTKRFSAYTLFQELTARSKLKQIKTTRLIKLKKL